MPSFSRRKFLKVSAMTLGAVAVSTGLSGCDWSDSDDDQDPRPVAFTHGVASGDPLQDAVILWTRAVPMDDQGSSLTLRWEVATDPDFTNLTHDGEMQAGADHDFTVKVDVRNLNAGQTYYYRFIAGGKTSITGVTRTLPEGALSSVKLAVMSCSN